MPPNYGVETIVLIYVYVPLLIIGLHNVASSCNNLKAKFPFLSGKIEELREFHVVDSEDS